MVRKRAKEYFSHIPNDDYKCFQNHLLILDYKTDVHIDGGQAQENNHVLEGQD